MKQHIDTLMQQNHVDALWISGAGQHNSAMVYFTGIAHLTGADLFVIPGRTPILCPGPMERDEAAKSGFDLLSYAEFDLSALLKETGGDLRTAYALRYKRILESIGLTKGKVLVYGSRDVGPYLAVVQELQKMLPRAGTYWRRERRSSSWKPARQRRAGTGAHSRHGARHNPRGGQYPGHAHRSQGQKGYPD
jgi:Xaa-Pro aminopeptidase